MSVKNNLILLSIIMFFHVSDLMAQSNEFNNSIPPVYSGIMDEPGKSYYYLSISSGDTNWQKIVKSYLNPQHLMKAPTEYSEGLSFDFQAPDFYGTIYYSVFPDGSDDMLFPVFIKSSRIIAGNVQINLTPYVNPLLDDTLGSVRVYYRLADQYGQLLYDGSVRIENKWPVIPQLSIIEGPFVHNLDDTGVVISFVTNHRCSASVVVGGREYSDLSKTANISGEIVHEIQISGLTPETHYLYKVQYGSFSNDFEFTTAPIAGTRKPFAIAFSSNSRGIPGGGEWDMGGVNVKSLKGALALARKENVALFQFSGNLIKGYTVNEDVAELQYHNWKKAVEFFGHTIPIYTTMGDHDVVNMEFLDGSKYGLAVDHFPFDTQSSEAVFADHFIHPTNGPQSEDGINFDPYPDKQDFPTYNENVYSYQYDNLAVMVLNSSYWSSTSNKAVRQIGGNPSGYIMDKQLQWVNKMVDQLEKDKTVDHILVVVNSPIFPTVNTRGMWYDGNNLVRPVIAAEPLSKGIIERRDELLNVLVNKSKKVALILTSSDQGYTRMEISPKTSLYDGNYGEKKLKINRTVWQISCGLLPGSGLKKEIYPWSEFIRKSAHQQAVVFLQINGDHLSVKVLNPLSLEEIETVVLK